ncbi:MAG: DUF2147 domain-containing protein [Pedobacter sp.]
MQKHLFIILLLFCSVNAFPQNKDLIVGKWLNATGKGHIQIYSNGNKFFGKLVWLKESLDENGNPKVDKHNPDKELSKRPVLGLVILRDFIFRNGIWEEGTIYDPKTGKTYSCKISLDSKNKMSVRGFVGISMLGRTENWTRIE